MGSKAGANNVGGMEKIVLPFLSSEPSVVLSIRRNRLLVGVTNLGFTRYCCGDAVLSFAMLIQLSIKIIIVFSLQLVNVLLYSNCYCCPPLVDFSGLL